MALVLLPAAVQLAALLATSTRYGFHRDELYFVAAGSHPALGYPDQPPLVPLISHALYTVDPGSPFLLRLPSALLAAATTVLAAPIAREAGGGRGAADRGRVHRGVRLRARGRALRHDHDLRPLHHDALPLARRPRAVTASGPRRAASAATFAAPTLDDCAMALIDRDESMLVVVDAQPGFLQGDAEQAVERMAWLVAVAARLGIPVVVTEEEPERNGATDARVAERLPAGAPVFVKPTFGLAGTPQILDAVRATGRATVVLVGAETDVCVAQSAVGLQGAGYACVVVDDATFSPGEMHERGLARLASEGVARNHAKGVTYEWLRTVEDAHAVLGGPELPPPPFKL